MLAAIRRIIAAPRFGDEQKDSQAFILNTVLWAFILLPAPYILGTAIISPASLMTAVVTCLVGEVVNLVLYLLLRKGYVMLASVAHVTALWLMITVLSVLTYGVRGMAYLVGYALIISLAGAMLGSRGALIFTVLSISTGGTMVWLENQNLLQFSDIPPSADYWIATAVLFPIGAVLQNISARTLNQALARARASETRFRSIVETIPDAIYIANGAGRFMEVNQSACAALGYTRSELLGRRVHDIVLPSHHARVDGILTHMQDFVGFVEDSHIRKDGSVQPVEVALLHIDYQGQPAMLGVARDTTERKRSEQERESLIRELETKNAELERFTYTVSHDLKSPLITIRGFVGLLERDLKNNNSARVASDLARISEASDRMQSLLDDLLELSRIGRMMNPSQRLSLESVVREALQQVEGRLTENRVTVRLAADLPVVWGDRARLVEVFQNLIDNAAKFMGNQPAPCIEIGVCASPEPGKACLFVRDNGIGIDPRYHDRIFGLFDKLDPHSPGTGIGLALVKRIVEVHEGRIWLESQPGQGATFFFSLIQME